VILPVITQLDIMPLQVLIDATVVEVNLKGNLKYGISWYFKHGGSAISSNIPVGGLGGAVQAVGAGLTSFYTSGQFQALLSAQANQDNLNVISSPSLMVLNNQKAKINVGEQVPIATGSSSAPFPTTGIGANNFVQSNTIQYKDTGVTLEVTPRVNANGMVIMKLKQIVSNVAKVTDPTQTQTQSPTINKKEIESNVAVNDGETIVLGGLISDSVTDNNSGIPWLYQLPLIGSLFGTTTKENKKTELVVLITPRVVASKQDSRVISNEFKRKLTGIYQEEVSQGGTNLILQKKGIN
ncbi:MAG: type II secretion system protein GspD, partial [Methylococcaceae bacterium]